jgi:4-amino-4-deoxy-L-arabinose transferase-like glycosyltransferase
VARNEKEAWMAIGTRRTGDVRSGDGQARNGHGTPTLLVVLACLLALRLLALVFNRTDLFFDEAQYWSWSLVPDFGYYSKPPLIAWIIRATTSVCGHGEACIRAGSPILHTVTAWFVYLAGRRLYDERAGFWAAIAFATLPGVSFSSGIISTDVPLLMCWTAALYAFVRLMDDPSGSWLPAVGLGTAIGLGLNAKYAMAYFIACAALFLVTTPVRRPLLRDPRLYGALAIAALLIAPNVVWNARNAFATLGHTADNANWGRSLFHPAKMAEFFLAQFGVFGPVFFAVLLWSGWQAWRTQRTEMDRLLLWFSLPILAVITMQAFLSRAHANWAAVAYVSGTLLVVAHLLRWSDGARWLRRSIVLHGAVAAVLAVGLATAGLVRLPIKSDPLARLLGWKYLGQAISKELESAWLAQHPYRAVLTDERLLTATLIYYLRENDTLVLAWRPAGAKPRDHYELTRPYGPASGEPVLLVSLNPTGGAVVESFSNVRRLEPITTTAGVANTRAVHLFAVSGYKSP